MRRFSLAPLCLSIVSLFLVIDAHGASLSPAHFWSQRFGGTGADVAHEVAVDAAGNIVVTGIFIGTANFGGANLVSAGLNDVFLAKYDANGAHLWSKRVGGTNTDWATSVATDAAGNIVIVGHFSGTTNFGGANLVSAGGFDIFLAKFAADGTHVWSQRFGSTTGDQGHAVAMDASGNIVMCGNFDQTVNFGGPLLSGIADAYVAKYNSSGTHIWSKGFGNTFGDEFHAVAIAASGNVAITGGFNSTVNFGGANLTSAGGYDIVIASYDAAGVHQWSKRAGGPTHELGEDVAFDAAGNVYATGGFETTADFGGGTFLSAGDDDVFLVKYSPAGAHQWSQRFGSAGLDTGYSLAVDAAANVNLAGYFSSTVSFGGTSLVSAGSTDVVVASYASNGTHRWSGRFGGTAFDDGFSASVDASGHVVVTGDFDNTINLGGSDLVSLGSREVYLVKFGNAGLEPAITAITDVGNDQGGQLRVDFARNAHDEADSGTPVVRYDAFRRNDAPPAVAVSSSSRDELLAIGWTQVGSVNAYGEPGYSIVVPTIGDSTTALGMYHSVFFIRAATTEPTVFFDSPIDSGYSLDNLAPGIPDNLIYSAGDLEWNESSAADFDFFTVYGANVDAFGSAVLVNYTTSPTMDVSASPYVYYFVTATDFSGNEGTPAKVNTLSGVGGTPKSYVLSVSNFPNPFNPRTTVNYTVPSRGAVRVAIYDLRGAHVATLFQGERAAGAFSIDWNPGATVSSGIYFARIEHNGTARSKKMVLLK